MQEILTLMKTDLYILNMLYLVPLFIFSLSEYSIVA